MRQFAGLVCEIITIVIYGFAVICGIFFHRIYVAQYQANGQEPKFPIEYYLVWVVLLAIVAVVSCIHHALASVIDNQCAIYGRLGMVRDMLERQSGNQLLSNHSEIVTGNNNQLQNSDMGTQLQSGEWICRECGTKNDKIFCTSCGHIKEQSDLSEVVSFVIEKYGRKEV